MHWQRFAVTVVIVPSKTVSGVLLAFLFLCCWVCLFVVFFFVFFFGRNPTVTFTVTLTTPVTHKKNITQSL